jgi:hypothetical protein
MVEDDEFVDMSEKEDAEAADEEKEESIDDFLDGESVKEPTDLFGIMERRLDEINDSLKDIALSLRKMSGREDE